MNTIRTTFSGIAAILVGALLLSLCLPGSGSAGQFLIEEPTVFSSMDAKSLGGIVLLAIINILLLSFFLRKTGVPMNPFRSTVAYGVSVGMSVIIVLVIQFAAGLLVEQTDSAADHLLKSQPAASINNQASADTPQSNSRFVHKIVQSQVTLILRGGSKYVVMEIVLAVLLFLIGGGYAGMDIHSPLLFQFIISTLGVGIVEESSKLLVGFLAYYYFRPKLPGSDRMIFLYFAALAGLAFGTGEAFYYFHQYQQSEAGFTPYLARVAWCVPLHMGWTLISATFFYEKFLGGSVEHSRKPAAVVLVFLSAIAPAAFMHGVYDSFAFRGMRAMWFLGAVSFVMAYVVVFLKKEGQRPILRQIAMAAIIGAAVFSVPHLLDYARHKTVAETCDRCNGTGHVVCQKCNGSGIADFHLSSSQAKLIKMLLKPYTRCPACNGTGQVCCDQCKGSGQTTHQVTLFGE